MSTPIQLSLDLGDERSGASQEDPTGDGSSDPMGTEDSSPSRRIDYTVKESARTRRVYLRVIPGRGLVITVPPRFPRQELDPIVESQRVWIEQALQDIDARTPAVYREWPPEVLSLRAIGREVSLSYQPYDPKRRTRVQWTAFDRLLLSVDPENRVMVAQGVAAPLKELARETLVPRLAELASRHGLRYRTATVRGQRSVWGSYSSSGTLSLNYKLLFLRSRLVDYVLLHELAHTRHLNHSKAFWHLLEQFEPDTPALDKELGSAGVCVPPWLELAR